MDSARERAEMSRREHRTRERQKTKQIRYFCNYKWSAPHVLYSWGGEWVHTKGANTMSMSGHSHGPLGTLGWEGQWDCGGLGGTWESQGLPMVPLGLWDSWQDSEILMANLDIVSEWSLDSAWGSLVGTEWAIFLLCTIGLRILYSLLVGTPFLALKFFSILDGQLLTESAEYWDLVNKGVWLVSLICTT